MILFISGEHERRVIQDSLEELDLQFGIEEICGSAFAPCMQTVVPWARDRGIPLSLHLPESLEEHSIISMNISIINTDHPNIVLSFDEDNENIVESLFVEAERSRSVEFVMRKA